MKRIFLSFLLLSVLGCNDSSTTETVTVKPDPVYRWMDREIYFAYSNGGNPNRNNEFQKIKVQEALNEISKDSLFLGEGYFSYTQVDEAVLQPIVETGLSATAYKSFILIWPDVDFNNFVVNTLGGVVPDQNGVIVSNASFKRKFYMIIKASCFTSSSACNGISTQGVKGLIARQMGFLVGIPPQTTTQCNADPENVMCPLPNNEQWNDANKIRFLRSFDNRLESILNNPNYYDENKVQ